MNEYDGEEEDMGYAMDGEANEEQKKQKIKQSLSREPRLECEVSDKVLRIESANIKEVTVKFYIIDAEILFSRTPFVKENTEEFSYVKPCFMLEKEIFNPDMNSSLDTTTFL